MNCMFVGQLEAIDPETKTIYIEFVPVKGGDNNESFTVELKKNPTTLTNFLRKIKAKVSRKNKTKTGSYVKYAKDLLDKKLGEFFVQRKDIQKLINKFNIVPRTVEGLIGFSRKVKLEKPLRIGETIYHAKTILRLTYEGR